MPGAILTVVLALGFLSGWLYFAQQSMIFYPSRELAASPADWRLEYEDVLFRSRDETALHGWYIPNQASKGVVLFFHGNAGNISHRGESIAIFHRLGLNVFIFDYRGYGRSQGKPGEKGLYLDAAAAWDYLTRTRGIEGSNIILFGRSLGGVVATKLASEVEPAALIVESAFSSARDFARSIFPILSRLTFMRYDFNAASYIKGVTCPVLILHSPDDEIMPYMLGEKLYRAANEPKAFVRLRGDHNSGFLQSQPEYERQLDSFIRSFRDRSDEGRSTGGQAELPRVPGGSTAFYINASPHPVPPPSRGTG